MSNFFKHIKNKIVVRNIQRYSEFCLEYIFFLLMTSCFVFPLLSRYKIWSSSLVETICGISAFVVGFFLLLFKKKNLQKSNDKVQATKKHYHWFAGKIPVFLHKSHWMIISILVIFSFTYYSRGIGIPNYSNDEFQVVDTAYGYLQTGQFKKWNFCLNELSSREYYRAFPHTWLVSQAMKIFGLGEWSTRIISTFFGVTLVIIGYFVAFRFTQNRLIAILVSCCLVVHPQLSSLFKITRMYAMLIPFFLVLFYCVHRFFLLLESDGFSAFKKPGNLLSPISILLLIAINAIIHINSLTIFIYIFYFVFLMTLLTRKPIFTSLFGIGAALCAVLYLVSLKFEFLKIFTNHMSAFKSDNYHYVFDLLEFPFGFAIGLICTLLSLCFLPFLSNRTARTNILSLFSMTAIGLVFFIFVANRYYASKYISFIMPISVLWIILSINHITKLFAPKWMKMMIIIMAFASLFAPLSQLKTPIKKPDFALAYQTIDEGYSQERNEIIAAQFLRCYYFQGISKRANIFDLGRGQQLTYKKFLKKILSAPSGWITWATKKSGHIKPRIRRFINKCFRQHHGAKLDNTGVEVFYFNQDMSCLRKRRNIPKQFNFLVNKNLPKVAAQSDSIEKGKKSKNKGIKNQQRTIRIDLSRPFTVAFWVKSNIETPGAPISFGSDYKNSFTVESREDFDKGGYRFRFGAKGRCHVLSTGYLNDGDWHWLALYRSKTEKGTEIGLYVDGEIKKRCVRKRLKKKISTFLTNIFSGRVQDIRVYDYSLTPDQMSAIYYQDRKIDNSSVLFSKGKPFSPKYHLVRPN